MKREDGPQELNNLHVEMMMDPTLGYVSAEQFYQSETIRGLVMAIED